jgi:uroporphyrinogen decarboxylase
MHKRERLERAIAGEPTDRPPVAVWRHFPGDDQRAADLARATVEFQRAYDWDFIRLTPSNAFSVTDYGVQDAWEGSLDGKRSITKTIIERSLDWTALRALDPMRGALGKQTDALSLVCDALAEEAPILQTLYSPLSQARDLAGNDELVRHLRTQPDRLHTGLNMLLENTLRYIDSLRRLPIAGICYVIDCASFTFLSEDEYRTFGLYYDRRVLESLPSKWWLNIIHLESSLPMFRCAAELHAQVINWRDRDSEPSLSDAKLIFNGALCGGISSDQHLHFGTPNMVREVARDAIQQMGSRRLILAAGGLTPVTTPLSNLRALRESVEGA